MYRHCRRLMLLCSALLVLTAPYVWPQATTGTLNGVVRDPSAAVIPGAAVTLTKTDTGEIFKSTTTATGFYEFQGLVPGPYLVTVESKGMAKFEGKLIMIVGQVETVNATLQVQNVAQQITVHDVTPMVQTNNGTQMYTIDQQRIQQLPFNGGFSSTERTIVNMATFAPIPSAITTIAIAANPRRPHQRTRPIAHIPQQKFQPRPAPRRARLLPNQRRIPKRPERRVPCLFGGHPSGNVLRYLPLQVIAHLLHPDRAAAFRAQTASRSVSAVALANASVSPPLFRSQRLHRVQPRSPPRRHQQAAAATANSVRLTAPKTAASSGSVP